MWALPKGKIDAGERARGDGAARGRGGDGRARRLVGKLGDVRYSYTRGTGERVFKVVSFYLVRYEGGRLGEIPAAIAHEVAEARWLPLAEAPRAARVRRRARDGAKALAALAEEAL